MGPGERCWCGSDWATIAGDPLQCFEGHLAAVIEAPPVPDLMAALKASLTRAKLAAIDPGVSVGEEKTDG